MAFEHIDGFELNSTTAIAARYQSSSSGAWTLVTGRTGSRAVDLVGGNFNYRRETARDNIIVGIAYKPTGWNSIDLIQLLDSGGTRQATLRTNADGTLSLYRGDPAGSGTLLATSAVITAGFWIHIELKYLVSDTVGSYTLRINEVSMFSGSNADTKETALANILDVTIKALLTNGGSVAGNQVDDFFVANFSQPIPISGFYGNRRVEALFPNAAGSVTGWTPLSGSNFQNVSDNPHDSDSGYNYASSVNTSDLYNMQNISTPNGTQIVLQTTYVARKDDALTRVTAPLLRSGGVTYVGGNDSLGTSYVYYEEMYNFNPNTSDYFSLTDINAIQAGIKVVS